MSTQLQKAGKPKWQPSGRFADPRTREGQLMWPARIAEPAVKVIEDFLGEIGTAGQLQQRPIPRGGGIVRDEQFKRYRFADILGTGDQPEFFDFQALSTDAAFKDTSKSSYVVIQAWGRRGANNYLLDQVRERMSFTKTVAAIKLLRTKFPKANACLIEDKANGPAIIDTIKAEVPGVIAVEPLGSKEARAEAAAPLIHAGNVWLPHEDECPWTKSFISEWLSVPTGAFWDQVDASGQYLLKYGRIYDVNKSLSEALASAVENAQGSAVSSNESPWSMNR